MLQSFILSCVRLFHDSISSHCVSRKGSKGEYTHTHTYLAAHCFKFCHEAGVQSPLSLSNCVFVKPYPTHLFILSRKLFITTTNMIFTLTLQNISLIKQPQRFYILKDCFSDLALFGFCALHFVDCGACL